MYENVLLIKDLTGITIKSALDPRLVDIDIFCYNLKRIFNEVFLSDTKEVWNWCYEFMTRLLLMKKVFQELLINQAHQKSFVKGKSGVFFSFSASYLENRSMYE